MKRQTTDLERFRDALLGDESPEIQRWLRANASDAQSAFVELGTLKPQTDGEQLSRQDERQRRRSWMPLLAIPPVGLAVGWVIFLLVTAPDFVDDFNDGWFDPRRWENPPEIKGAGVKEEKGFLRLVNRGALVTRSEFPTPVEVTVRWKWINLGLNPNYADYLTIVTRTSGQLQNTYPYEALDGVRVTFNANGGGINIAQGRSPKADLVGLNLAIPMPADEWITVRVVDDGRRISVFMAGPEIDPKFEHEPIYQKDVLEHDGGKRIAIYNRELVAYPHESNLDLVRLDRLRPN